MAPYISLSSSVGRSSLSRLSSSKESADLQVFTALAKDNLTLRAAIKAPTTPAAPAFNAVRASVTGVPR